MNLKYQSETRIESTPSLRLPAWLIGVLIALLFFCSSVQAQFSNVEYFQNLDQSSSPSATDILSRKTTVGRFGPVSRGGWLSPSPNTNRRFSEGAVYTTSGGFVGLSTNSPNSRFQSWWNESQTLPQTDYSIYSDFLSMKRGTDGYGRRKEYGASSQRQASSQAPLPYPTRTAVQDRRDTEPLSVGPSQSQPIRTPGTTEQIWMRGSLPGNTQTPGPVMQPNQSPQEGRGVMEGQRLFTNEPPTRPSVPQPPLYPTDTMRSAISAETGRGTIQPGTIQQNTTQQNITPQDAAKGLIEQQQYEQRRLAGTSIQQLQAQQGTTSVESIQSSLEQLLVRNPSVKPLSPIQVQFRDGIATVRGVVPSQTHRVEAGRVLLSDPRVKTVDNQLTVLPANSKD
ncbi:MAG: BON domain-containing protein [Planctomycetia bacterium]|nr:BON domain-containing protein [Planctomycetia bacterium]